MNEAGDNQAPEVHEEKAEEQSVAPAERHLAEQWQLSLTDEGAARSAWLVMSGVWSWESASVKAKASVPEWSELRWLPCSGDTLRGLRNFVIEITISGKAEAAGLSFGDFKDFLTKIDARAGTSHLQLEVDLDAGVWAFRVNGQLIITPQWWSSKIQGVEDFFTGALSFKARRAEEIHFSDFNLRTFTSSCRLSVVITCYRFLQRLRLSLRNWCHQDLPHGAYEILVVNPQSPDGVHEHLAAVTNSYPHVRVRELPVAARIAKNKGAMINSGIAASRGEWIWLADADCLFAPASASTVLRHVTANAGSLFFGQRRYLSMPDTNALLAGRFDSLLDYATLANAPGMRPADNAPWGYTQIAHRTLFTRLHYNEQINHFAHSDNIFVEACKRSGVQMRQVPGLFCLHLDHPFSWYGAESFL